MIHQEEHFSGGEILRDIVIGMADGLTVPFALAAGISGALVSSHIVVTAGLAEVAAGSIAMGLGGYLAARGNSEHYASELRREEIEIIEKTGGWEEKEILDVFTAYGVTAEESAPIVSALKRNPMAWRDFMMKFELGLEEPDPKRALQSAVTIAVSYIVGGLVPLWPYMVWNEPVKAVTASVVATLTALLCFGFIKGHFTGVSRFKSAFQTALTGGLAALVAFGLAKAIS